ncbi:MAG TPA: DUF1552 domain-containing protein [Bryobacteraceae bacterium]|nr:DUF1552 domain-containing protein [Bryobacteraceae bacterium]
MIITKKHLSRRTLLRGIGTTLALPLLDSMVPALTAAGKTPARPVARLGVVYVPNGIYMSQWNPSGDNPALQITPILESMAAHRDRLVMLSGLANKEGDPLVGEGAGDHARAAGAFLTGVHPKKTEGADIQAGTSMDQIAARELGKETQLASLEVALESREAVGACDPGYSCAYANTLCWSSPTTPLPMENDPRAVFERLFGSSDTTDAASRLARISEDRSILDVVTAKVARLERDLSPHDRTKLDQYLEAIRDVERRIQKAEAQSAKALPVVNRPAGIPERFEDHAKLMYDMQLLAYQADLTRVITFMVAHESSTRAYPEIGVPDAHHALSHHGGNQQKIALLIRINLHHAKMFGYYLDRLASTPDGDGSLLDHVMLLYGSGMSDGNRHNHHDLPILLAGGGAGRIQGGRHLRYPQETPMANLYLSLLDKLGVPTGALGDSTGKVDHLSDV